MGGSRAEGGVLSRVATPRSWRANSGSMPHLQASDPNWYSEWYFALQVADNKAMAEGEGKPSAESQ
jgi:hypothetical protein